MSDKYVLLISTLVTDYQIILNSLKSSTTPILITSDTTETSLLSNLSQFDQINRILIVSTKWNSFLEGKPLLNSESILVNIINSYNITHIDFVYSTIDKVIPIDSGEWYPYLYAKDQSTIINQEWVNFGNRLTTLSGAIVHSYNSFSQYFSYNQYNLLNIYFTDQIKNYRYDYDADISGNSSQPIIVVKEDGNLWGKGNNNYYAMGIGSDKKYQYWTNITSKNPAFIGKTVSYIYVGYTNSLILFTDNTLWFAGTFLGNSVTNQPNYTSLTFIQITQDMGIINKMYGTYKCLFILSADGNVWQWGIDLLNGGHNGSIHFFICNPTRITQLSCGNKHVIAVTSQNSILGLGSNYDGELGITNYSRTFNTFNTFTSEWGYQSEQFRSKKIKKISCGYKTTTIMMTDGSIWNNSLSGFQQIVNSTRINIPSQLYNSIHEQDSTIVVCKNGLFRFGIDKWASTGIDRVTLSNPYNGSSIVNPYNTMITQYPSNYRPFDTTTLLPINFTLPVQIFMTDHGTLLLNGNTLYGCGYGITGKPSNLPYEMGLQYYFVFSVGTFRILATDVTFTPMMKRKPIVKIDTIYCEGYSGMTSIITGMNLSSISAIYLGIKSCTITEQTDQHIKYTIPEGTGTAFISIEDNYSDTLELIDDYSIFNYFDAPVADETVGFAGKYITFTGSNLLSVGTVYFGTNQAEIITGSNTTLVVRAPEGTGKVNITFYSLTNPKIKLSITNVFYYIAISSQSKFNVFVGDSVSLIGSNFLLGGVPNMSIQKVKIGSQLVNAQVTDTQITFTVPEKAYDDNDSLYIVLTKNGVDIPLNYQSNALYYIPYITGVTPMSGTTGQSMVITGKYLSSIDHILFAHVNSELFDSSIFTRSNTSTIQRLNVTIPPTGYKNISRIITLKSGNVFGPRLKPDAIFAPGVSNVFTFTDTAITNINPVYTSKGIPITISGTNFWNISSVQFGSISVTPTTISDTTILVNTPDISGNVSITITDKTGIITQAPTFTVYPIIISSISPLNGTENTPITLTGNNLLKIGDTLFNTSSSVLVSKSNTSLIVKTPSGTGSSIINLKDLSNNTIFMNNSSRFTYQNTSIISMTPVYGEEGTMVNIYGSNVKNTAYVNFVNSSFVNTSIQFPNGTSDSNVIFNLPPDLDTCTISITDIYGNNKIAGSFFSRPKAKRLHPTNGIANTPVTIVGTNLMNVSSVYFGSSLVTIQPSRSNTSLIVTSPSLGAATEYVNINLIDKLNNTIETPVSFYYRAPPLITAIDTRTGSIYSQVTLTGSNLLSMGSYNDLKITFGNIATGRYITKFTETTIEVEIGFSSYKMVPLSGTINAPITIWGSINNLYASFSISNEFSILVPYIASVMNIYGGKKLLNETSPIVLKGENLNNISRIKLYDSRDTNFTNSLKSWAPGQSSNIVVNSSTQITITTNIIYRQYIPSDATSCVFEILSNGLYTYSVPFDVEPYPTIITFGNTSGMNYTQYEANAYYPPVDLSGYTNTPITMISPTYVDLINVTVNNINVDIYPINASDYNFIIPSGISNNTVSIVASHKTFGYTIYSTNYSIIRPIIYDITNDITFPQSAITDSDYRRLLYKNIPITISGKYLDGVKSVTIGEKNASIISVYDANYRMTVIVPEPPDLTDQVSIKLIDNDQVSASFNASYIRDPVIESVSNQDGPSGRTVYIRGKYLDLLHSEPDTKSELSYSFYATTYTNYNIITYPDFEKGIYSTSFYRFTSLPFNQNALGMNVYNSQVITQPTTKEITLYRKFANTVVSTTSFNYTFSPTPVITSVTPSSGYYGILVKAIGTNLTYINSRNSNGISTCYVVSDTIMYINTTYLQNASILYGSMPIPLPFTGSTTRPFREPVIEKSIISGVYQGTGRPKIAAGETVTLILTGFTNIYSLDIYDGLFTPFTMVDSTTLTFVMPDLGTIYPILKTETEPRASYTLKDTDNYTSTTFFWLMFPVITTISTTTGLTGTLVRINGTKLTKMFHVTVNQTEVVIPTKTDTYVEFNMPYGVGDVTIIAYDSVLSSTYTFTYTEPNIVSISPLPVSEDEETFINGIDGDLVTLDGFNFTNNMIITLNGVTVTPSLKSSTHVEFTILPGVGSVPLVITDGNTLKSYTFVYPEPNFLYITPDSGKNGTVVTLKGSYMSPNATIQMNDLVVPSTYSKTDIVFTIPDETFNNNIVVQDLVSGVSYSNSFTFNYQNPMFTHISPIRGFGGTLVTLFGQYIYNATITVAGITVSYSKIGDTLQFSIPARAGTDTVNVIVSDSSVVATFPFTYFIPDPVFSTLTNRNFSPGKLIRIQGLYLTPNVNLKINNQLIRLFSKTSESVAFSIPSDITQGDAVITDGTVSRTFSASYSATPVTFFNDGYYHYIQVYTKELQTTDTQIYLNVLSVSGSVGFNFLTYTDASFTTLVQSSSMVELISGEYGFTLPASNQYAVARLSLLPGSRLSLSSFQMNGLEQVQGSHSYSIPAVTFLETKNDLLSYRSLVLGQISNPSFNIKMTVTSITGSAVFNYIHFTDNTYVTSSTKSTDAPVTLNQNTFIVDTSSSFVVARFTLTRGSVVVVSSFKINDVEQLTSDLTWSIPSSRTTVANAYPVGTLVKTDSGLVPVEQMVPGVHNLKGKTVTASPLSLNSTDALVALPPNQPLLKNKYLVWL